MLPFLSCGPLNVRSSGGGGGGGGGADLWLKLLVLSVSCVSVVRTFVTLADFVLVDNGLYMGEYRGGRPDGEGIVVYFTDDVLGRYNYTGHFVRGQRQGQGQTAFRDGRIYQGDYDKGKENGRGKITYSNGDVFRGFFLDGRREGSGTLTFKAGGRREGSWTKDRLDGFVFFHSPSQTSSSSPTIERWKGGRRVGDRAKERDLHQLRSSRPPTTTQRRQQDEKLNDVDSDSLPSSTITSQLPGNFSRDARGPRGARYDIANAGVSAGADADAPLAFAFAVDPEDLGRHPASEDLRTVKRTVEKEDEQKLRYVYERVNK